MTTATAGETGRASSAAHVAHNYNPLPVIAEYAAGAWITDTDGRRYLDMLGAYSAMNFGHGHPRLVAAARAQLERMTLVSRAFDHNLLGEFAARLTALTGTEMMIPMNTGAEAVETAIKIARKWAYEVKGVPDGRAEIIVAAGNFHGRTTTIVGFSDDPGARNGFGPYTPGFISVPYGDADAVARAVTPNTAAVLLEPVQGEAGVIIPPPDYLPAVRRLCTERGVLFVADEVQSGLGRTGTTLAVERVGVTPDLVVLGKALGGGIVPVSAVVGRREILGVLRPGQHGSTFGGNPLACAVGLAVVELLSDGYFQRRAARLGDVLAEQLNRLRGRGVNQLRTAGLWAGIDIDPELATGRQICERLATRGILAKDTHGSTIRLSPPLVIEEDELVWAVGELGAVLAELESNRGVRR
ncbi:ornithine--oxo-acid transaminase [Nocardia pseudobrasiliensis]|uniref:ornithine aminotransferase n=1 Tax=Nocardia pseudobrasiliensis TaxID=45979 RepID=A0A370IBS9_9NOCA|nr:ornithine--oxo-acid transaminase [Nocardia pseudobrasiliensis]RDI68195.1 ornithine--oxo-acid transaminase [Nocardia pseudobrasiliensis]